MKAIGCILEVSVLAGPTRIVLPAWLLGESRKERELMSQSKMKKFGRRRVRFAAGLLCVVALVGSSAAPGYAGQQSSTASETDHGVSHAEEFAQGIIQSYNFGSCLDSNINGSVYLSPCTANNNYQQWKIWNTGWTQNVATGRCLTRLKLAGNENRLRTADCADIAWNYQLWTHWHGGWYQNHSVDNFGQPLCITAYDGPPYVDLFRCYAGPHQYWYVWPTPPGG